MEGLGLALALMLVVEGLMPLLGPGQWRAMFSRLLQLSDGQLRFIGLMSVVVGLGLMLLMR
ncbi:hypothetical protein HNQ51_001037 [Inhella inkyongensis]|uniref:DUF2065 domain-containing protein n=1 Tax=Inhella inkyongensis TaxID=392593 RepID=A0A840S4J8_9BURK|nr:DUF2065 domain-containing protein [Inhella inkyongensis]MBB5203744.1 hypothetical protein [Inhella inkyongensis]